MYWPALSYAFNLISVSAWISNTLEACSLYHHTLSVKHIQASRHVHEHAIITLVMRLITFVTPSTQGWHLNRKLANICLGNKCTISTSTSDPLSFSLYLRRPVCWGKWRQEGKKEEERDITVCVCHLTFQKSLSPCCCSSLLCSCGISRCWKVISYLASHIWDSHLQVVEVSILSTM